MQIIYEIAEILLNDLSIQRLYGSADKKYGGEAPVVAVEYGDFLVHDGEDPVERGPRFDVRPDRDDPGAKRIVVVRPCRTRHFDLVGQPEAVLGKLP